MEPEGLPPLAGGWVRQERTLGERSLQLWLPADPDALLDDDRVQARNRLDDYMPYWAWLWGSADTFALLLLAHGWAPGTRVLELGAGVGVVGLAALVAKLNVTFSDMEAVAVQLAQRNARENGFEGARGWVVDWRALEEAPNERFPLLLGCERHL